MESSTFHYGESPCPVSLRPWLWNYWEFRVHPEGDGVLPHHVPPDGCTSIVFSRTGTVIQALASGPWLEPFVVPVAPGSHYWGVRCRPEAGALLLGTVPERLINRSQRVDGLAAGLGSRWSQAMAKVEGFQPAVAAMDQVFADHLRHGRLPDQVVKQSVDRLVVARGELAIEELAGQLGISGRTLRRRFRTATGLTPKQFARICRFRYAAIQMVEGSYSGWAQMASGAGFADQAHMIHEFKDLTGLTPEGLDERMRKTSHRDLIV